MLGHQRRLNALPAFAECASLDDLLVRSDAVVLACPLNDATRGLLDARRLSLMPRHAVLVKVARGAVVVEDALVAALRERRIGGAALDVFDTQPLRADHPLLALDNVLLAPHVAGLTRQSMHCMSVGTAEEVRRLLSGHLPRNLVNVAALR